MLLQVKGLYILYYNTQKEIVSQDLYFQEELVLNLVEHSINEGVESYWPERSQNGRDYPRTSLLGPEAYLHAIQAKRAQGISLYSIELQIYTDLFGKDQNITNYRGF